MAVQMAILWAGGKDMRKVATTVALRAGMKADQKVLSWDCEMVFLWETWLAD